MMHGLRKLLTAELSSAICTWVLESVEMTLYACGYG